MKTKQSIYLDMDDVCFDWIAKAHEILGFPDVTGEYYSDEKWNQLKQVERFYLDLPLKKGATELVNWATFHASKHNKFIAFLTAIPHDNSNPYVFHDKFVCARKYFPDIPVFFGPYSYDKEKHCKRGDILIDDRLSNCSDWIRAGGIAHQYTTWENCKEWIRSNYGDEV